MNEQPRVASQTETLLGELENEISKLESSLATVMMSSSPRDEAKVEQENTPLNTTLSGLLRKLSDLNSRIAI